ncbi:MAG: VOC family protein [Gammaproteobacteria bacterium]|nr:VOC family protein [Gammaproteobacteria bacterium]
MIGYVTLGTNDLARAGEFYDGLLRVLGAQRAMAGDRMIAWAIRPDQPMLVAIMPFDGKPATVGNGVMVALQASSREQVDELHRTALALGGSDEGAPGPRFGGVIYAAYFRDRDGNKLDAFIRL